MAPAKQPVVSAIGPVLAGQIPAGVVPAVEIHIVIRHMIDTVTPCVSDTANLTAGDEANQNPNREAAENSVHRWSLSS